ncbi:MAG: hypothetical protein A2958_01875 [Candidatus Levybacteria bacterium RIFCSPLOWO2_01_FULL_38_13]|nr:MAG: hypothetical protein A2629_02630 [Candidatus Levybacteria bacterium RIFCSPHIGHO2_01_FULL_41_15]OGH35705.1 MAG: hypothetical protein A2958_01875 [Candidatus Levybacteria bacterium RIFCSPLOWO2_01_FULL_38_13]
MFIPLAETPVELRPGGEERNCFYFYERDPNLPLEVKITRLPPHFDMDLNWHRHKFVEEFSVPLIGEVLIKEKKDADVLRKRISEAILKKGEWVVGIECKSTKSVKLLIEKASGGRRKVEVIFIPEYTEGKDWHTVGNPTDDLVVMLTLKRVPRKIFRKDPMVFQVDREKK